MQALIDWLAFPMQFGFMQTALLVGVAVGIVCALLSCFLVLKGWSLIGDAISHAVLPGIVIAYLLGIALSIGAFVSGIFCALLTGFIKDHSRVKQDTAMGIVFSGMFALGLLMFAKVETDQHLMHILFGNMLGITESVQNQILAISAVVSLLVVVLRKPLIVYCFDQAHARVVGLSVNFLHYGLLVMLALTIVAAIQAVGVIMVVAMLVAPGITGFVVSKRFNTMLVVAVTVSVTANVLGIWLSFYIDGATSACIVLVQAAMFVVALLVSYLKGFSVDTASLVRFKRNFDKAR
ncbi:metal ABC transporter permease [Vibrio sp. SCSIO 43136]|uniref:metal ABC transporter permease n=1 Tax=Vibrio sp. SCSIO 43136 TaxID=2819101 RepID=UPI002075FEB5|nr:metal ABC transporter permease [Vibrio sp. SCSIO 43136]USD67465.1 metal ABC transporter permease [Vibrio sp. SCSIO 43136]